MTANNGGNSLQHLVEWSIGHLDINTLFHVHNVTTVNEKQQHLDQPYRSLGLMMDDQSFEVNLLDVVLSTELPKTRSIQSSFASAFISASASPSASASASASTPLFH